MKKIRKVNTKKRKRRKKDAQQAVAARTAQILDHPMECCVCDTLFERTQETVRSWQVTVVKERVRLTCPQCWGTITETVEKLNEI